MAKRPINVLIVDDSRVAQELLEHVIKSDPDFKIMGIARTGEETLAWLRGHTADVITMDILMPGMTGLEVTRHIMTTKPIPIVIVSSAYQPSNEQTAFEAIEAGALAILEKPRIHDDTQAKELLTTLKMVSEVKLVRRHGLSPRTDRPHVVIPEVKHASVQIEAIAIGASLGGPLALTKILSSLEPDFPVPILIVQHIAAGFTQGFVQWLQDCTRLPVHLGRDCQPIVAGNVYVAPAGAHMEVEKNRTIHLRKENDSLMPSVAKLFASMAKVYGPSGIGVILTGMGRDGAEELLLMRNKGALTLAQDRDSCVMFGMPQVAIALEAVDQTLPLDDIAEALKTLVARKATQR